MTNKWALHEFTPNKDGTKVGGVLVDHSAWLRREDSTFIHVQIASAGITERMAKVMLDAMVEAINMNSMDVVGVNKTARDALRPFADYADPSRRIRPDFVLTAGSPLAKRQLTMGDCYAAHDAVYRSGIHEIKGEG